ncbi:MAG TPA: hypothetical protein VGG03_16445 [Thermoanaerobaculia bacterium]|jgi:Na+/melibiose symporter-like transporter
MGTGSREDRRGGRRRAAAWVAVPVALALMTLLARGLGVNAATAGFLYLVLVLGLLRLLSTSGLIVFRAPRRRQSFSHPAAKSLELLSVSNL